VNGLAQPQPASPTPSPTPLLGPILPTEGLLELGTWEALGRRLLTRVVDALPALVAAVVVLFVFLVLARITTQILTAFLSRTRADPALVHIAERLTRSVIVVFGVIMAASQAGLAVGSLLAGVGVVGLAVGLAAQDTLASVVAGLTILWDRPFRLGDTVTIAETYGVVTEIGIRTTRLRTPDHRDVLLPNKQVIEDKIINHTLHPLLRLDIPIGIAYHQDSRQAREVLLAAVDGHPRLDPERGAEVVLVELADSAVVLHLRAWLADPSAERAAWVELLELAKVTLDEAGIQIPFPQRTVHLGRGVARELGELIARRDRAT